MGVPAQRGLLAALFAGAVWISLAPKPEYERWLDTALLPARALGEFATPLSWARVRSIRAAEQALQERTAGELDARAELDSLERRAALPSTPELAAGRRFVHASVVGRLDEHFDFVVVEPEGGDLGGLEPGMPVIAGDVFVGRVESVGGEPGRAVVELLTAKDFAVGAVLEPPEGDSREPLRFVAGGVFSERRADARRELAIAVHNPSSSRLWSGLARVDESYSTLERFAAEARGFELGRLVERERGDWTLEPRIDYSAGLFRVAIVGPESLARAASSTSADVLFDGLWREARVLSRGDPSLARRGLKLALGAWQGAREGSAVVAGARLAGLVAHASPLSSDVRTLGDRGVALAAVASIAGRAEPFVVGTLLSLGREDGALALHWEAVVPLESAARARLFTAAGSDLVPRGLLIGECELPAGPGPHVLRVVQDFEPLELRALWIRVARESEAAP